MSRIYLLIISLGLIMILGSACQPVADWGQSNDATLSKIDSLENMYKGVWRLESILIHFPDTVVDLAACLPVNSIYHIGPGRFTVMYFDLEGSLQNASYGRFEIENDSVFLESIDYHTNSSLGGNQIKFNTNISGDRWSKSAMLPVSDIECIEDLVEGYSTPHFLWEEVRVRGGLEN